MKERIIDLIKEQNGKMTFRKLTKKIDIDTDELKKILKELKIWK